MKEHLELKQLQSQRDDAVIRLSAAKDDVHKAQDRAALAQKDLQFINVRIDKLKRSTNKIIVSEHAILRYLERVRGVDIEAVKKEILPDDNETTVRSFGNGIFPINGSHKVKVENGVVVTVITKEMK